MHSTTCINVQDGCWIKMPFSWQSITTPIKLHCLQDQPEHVVLSHSSCRFGRSHMYFGAVMTVYCLAILAAKSKNGSLDWPMVKSLLLVLWAPVLVIISLLFGPFWFTPFAFRTDRVQVRRGCWAGRVGCISWSS